MTDELSIQPQVIQERKRDNSGAAGAAGVVVGGAAGYGINRWVQKPMSHDDIVAEINDKDKYESRTKEGAKEAATWKEVKEKADEVNRLKEAAEKTPEKVLPETEQEAKDLKRAKEARDTGFARLVEQEKAKGGVVSSGNALTAKKFEERIKAADLKVDEYNQYFGDKASFDYLKEYETQRAKLDTNVATYRNALRQKLDKTAGSGSVPDIYQQLFNGLSKDQKEGKKEFSMSGGSRPAFVKNQVNAILPEKVGDLKSLRNIDHYNMLNQMFGEDFIQILEEKPEGFNSSSKNNQIIPKAGKKYYIVLPDKEAIKGARETLKTQFTENGEKYLENKVKLYNFDKDFFEANKEVLNKELTESINSSADISKFKKMLADTKAELENIRAIEVAFENKLPGASYGTYGTEKAMLIRKDILTKTQDTISSYYSQRGELTKALQSIYVQDGRVAYARTALHNAIKDDPAMKAFLEKIEKELNGAHATETDRKVYSAITEVLSAETTELSQSEIEAKVRESAQFKGLEKEVERFQTEYNKALETKGVANDAGQKAAKEALEAAQKSLKESAESLGKKMAKGGTNPWLAAGIGALALGLTAFGISKSNQS